MLIGQFEYRIDEKGRVPIPPKFRSEELKKEGVVLCPGLEKYIAIYPLSEWKKLSDSLTSSNIIPSKMRKLNRVIFANAFNAETDAQGRIVIPSYLRQYASIGDDVIIAGVNTHMEMWSKKQWDIEMDNDQEEARLILDTIEERKRRKTTWK